MTTYADLKADILNEAIRPNLTAQVPRFIRQAEQRIRRDIRVTDMERRARSIGTNSRYLKSPPGFLEMRRLWNVISTNGRSALTQVSPQALRPSVTGGKLPTYYALTRGQPPEIEFDSSLASDREVEMVYMKAYDPLVNDTDTNWLLSNAYDVYFEGALYYLFKHDRNNEEAAHRAAGYKAAVAEIDTAERRQTYMQPIFATSGHNVV